jgi:RNA polymerase sigma-70 factor (ECF subfamily)
MQHDLTGNRIGIPFHRPKNRKRINSDEELIENIAIGSKSAMRELFVRHHEPVYRFLMRMLGNKAVAEDVTSEVFLSAWRQAHRFEARSAVSTWLLAIAHQKGIAAVRRWPSSISDEHRDAADCAPDSEATLQSKHRGEMLCKCLKRLCREHREIMDLVYYHEKSVQEVSEILGIPRNVVKTRMIDARQELLEHLTNV